ncbi:MULTISPECIES: hypothetical protein [unclassified Bradyrhizobium]|uniref:hypothetical protein n=1 Tax=unclassified Bradyrhizobium TaxID=2631580 RepID=UPI0029161372|nr:MULTISPECIES: hypothetical protein [unclassified Bradyrhizobium]
MVVAAQISALQLDDAKIKHTSGVLLQRKSIVDNLFTAFGDVIQALDEHENCTLT